jgi:hypothetical protein
MILIGLHIILPPIYASINPKILLLAHNIFRFRGLMIGLCFKYLDITSSDT